MLLVYKDILEYYTSTPLKYLNCFKINLLIGSFFHDSIRPLNRSFVQSLIRALIHFTYLFCTMLYIFLEKIHEVDSRTSSKIILSRTYLIIPLTLVAVIGAASNPKVECIIHNGR